jgi:Bacterial Ig domain
MRLRLLLTCVVFGLLPAGSALGATRTINFDDPGPPPPDPAPTLFMDTHPLTDRYADLGVHFAGPEDGAGGAILNASSFTITGESPPNFLAFNPSASYPSGKTASGPETVTFDSPIHAASINAGQSSGGTVTVTAFDGSTPVSTSFRTSAQAIATLSVQAARITSLRLEFTGSAIGFDDLVWATSPVSPGDAFSTTENAPLTVPAAGVLHNDSDADGDPLTATVSRGPANGAVNLHPDGGFTYTPRSGFSGTDTFGYRANDGTGNGDEANVSIQVVPLPPPPPPPPPLLSSTVSNSFLAFRKYTKVALLAVNDLPAGARVRTQCKTKKKKQQKKGCPYRSRTVTSAKARTRLGLLKPFKRKKLPVGTKVTITITAPGFVGKQFIYTMRAHKKPKRKRLCIPPGGKPGRCTT